MTVLLLRITTEFSQAEDRIRIVGEKEGGGQVVIWLTRRLLGFLLPVLFKQLDSQFAAVSSEHREALQEFAQQAAREAIGGAAPVKATQDDEAILASAVDINGGPEIVHLTFRNLPDGGYRIPLAGEALRQWLHMLHQMDQKANWQLPQWPGWLAGPGAAPAAVPSVLH